MPTRDSRLLPVAILILAGLQIGLPWAAGGTTPAGHVSLVLLLVLAAAVASLPRGTGSLLRPSPWLLLATILAGGSALKTMYPDRTIQSLLLVAAYFLAYALAARGARGVSWAEPVLLSSIVTSGLLVSGVGLYHLLRGGEGGMYARVLTGPFGYPNAMAGFLLLVVGAVLAVAQENRRPVVRGSAILAGAVFVLGLVLTRSRGALLAAAVASVLWAAVQRQNWRPRRALWLPLGALGILGMLALLGIQGTSFFSGPWTLNAMGDSSFLWRWQILGRTWAMIRDHPWLGVGPGAFPAALNRYQQIPYVGGMSPHNLYAELVAEYGLPAGLLAMTAFGGFFWRVATTITQAPVGDRAAQRLAILLPALVAFTLHSLVDIDWTFPAISLMAATMFGLASGHLRQGTSRQGPAPPAWWACVFLLLAVVAILAVTRYYATALVTWGRLALSAGETAMAQRDLTWALRLNPLSFPAHEWLAWARLRSGDSQGALEVAEQAVRAARSDPNSLRLGGEIAAAAGRWRLAEERFRTAVERARYSQLRFHAGLVEAAAQAGNSAEALHRYDQAVAIFTPDRVLASEARCLAPGDRYLLARMSRIAAQLYAGTGDQSREKDLLERARHLAQPDLRGICTMGGRPGQTSPEATAQSFWQALAEGGWPSAGRFLIPELRRLSPDVVDGAWGAGQSPPRARLAWIARLSGGEQQVSLQSEVEIEHPGANATRRCSQMDLRIITDDWFVEKLPLLEPGSCQP